MTTLHLSYLCCAANLGNGVTTRIVSRNHKTVVDIRQCVSFATTCHKHQAFDGNPLSPQNRAHLHRETDAIKNIISDTQRMITKKIDIGRGVYMLFSKNTSVADIREWYMKSDVLTTTEDDIYLDGYQFT